ncbi:LysR family transcriptional regulator [Sphingomonas sp. GB1N7]|uniref:LysR substrate-binding domain-containing protein n=1 Tax=Parasphingomonas caseinilytica TaxID=3096158 RepID=UPI002FCA18FE
MIDITLLRYALAAADTGSFSRAADTFGVKQSTLSKRVHYFEARLGLLLFQRSPRGVVPTSSGQRFLTMARRILDDVDALTGASRALAKGDAGRLRLGFCGSLATGDLSATLASYRKVFPDIEIEARENGRTRLLNRLEGDEIDVAVLAGRPERRGVQSLSFWKDPLTVAVPAGDPLAARAPLYWSDLRDHGFMVTANDPGPDIAAMIIARLSVPGHCPSIISQDVSRENLAQFGTIGHLPVMAGAAPELMVDPSSHSYHEIHDASGPTALDQGVHWRRSNTSPVLKCFLQHLSQRYARPIPRA